MQEPGNPLGGTFKLSVVDSTADNEGGVQPSQQFTAPLSVDASTLHGRLCPDFNFHASPTLSTWPLLPLPPPNQVLLMCAARC